MSTDEYLTQLEALLMAKATASVAIKILKEKRKIELKPHFSKPDELATAPPRPEPKTDAQLFAIKNNLWPEAKELLQSEEVGWEKASEFLGIDIACKHLARPSSSEQSKLRRMLKEKLIRTGKSTIDGSKNTYCTISLVEFVMHGEEAIRNAQTDSQKERSVDPIG